MRVADLPAIETPRLRIARLARADAAALRAITDDPAITSAIHFLASPFREADAQALIRGDCFGVERFFGAWTKDPRSLAGVIGGGRVGADEIEIGYWFGTRFQRQRYATEAVAGFIGLLRGEFPDCRIVAECRRDNAASWRLLTRLGFAPSGTPGTRPLREKLLLT